MKCNEFVRKLETVAPGLSGQTIIPAMTHFLFDGVELMTFSEKIAMTTPCETEFKGAAPPHILPLLKVSKSGLELSMKQTDTELRLLLGEKKQRTAKFPYIDQEDYADMFTMPKMGTGKDATLPAKIDDLRLAFKCCLQSVGTDTSRADLRGITFIPKGKTFLLFSTNENGMTRCELDFTTSLIKKRFVLPRNFCEIFIDLTKGVKGEHIEFQITEDYALARVGDVMLYGKLPEVEMPTEYERIFDAHYPSGSDDKLIPIPQKFEAIVERAMVVTDADVDQERTELTVDEDGWLRAYSKSKRGEVDDEMPLTDEKKKIYHPKVGPIKVYAEFLKLGLALYDQMLITKQAVIMASDRRVYMISTSR